MDKKKLSAMGTDRTYHGAKLQGKPLSGFWESLSETDKKKRSYRINRDEEPISKFLKMAYFWFELRKIDEIFGQILAHELF